MTRRLSALSATMALVLAGAGACTQGTGDQAAGEGAPLPTGRAVVEAAATALGGVDRIQALRTLTLQGYGQYAYQYGGGNITGSPDAPMKLQAANDLRRVYDFENRRWRLLERRNFLFPFAIYGGHNFAPVNQVLDGDIAYDVAPDGATVRVGPTVGLGADGPRERRMWMLSNPVAAVRAGLDAGTTADNVRREDDLTLVDLRVASGDVLTLATGANDLPAWVRWSGPHGDLGEVGYTTHFVGYMPFSGIQLPMGYTTRLDWRDVDYLKIYVDGYTVDGPVDDMAAPETVRAAPEPVQSYQAEITPIARGLWRITGGTMVIEFADHMTLFEINGGPVRAAAVIAAARTIVPDKPVTELIVSHNHFDHTAGLRTAVANGLRIISRRNNEGIFREMTTRATPAFPDALGRNPQPLAFTPVDDQLTLEDGTMTVQLFHTIANNHMADSVFAYIPEHRILIEADTATAALDLQWWGDSWQQNIDYRNLDVAMNVPVHMDVMDHAATTEMVRGGIERVKAFCAEHLAKGTYFPGCPAWVQ